MMNNDASDLLRSAFDAYLIRRKSGGLEPSEKYLPYDFDRIDEFQWRLLGNDLVTDELREVTNNLNYWHVSLARWQAWNTIIQPYSADKAWELRREFLEPLAHHCLLQPSAIRDTFTSLGTNSLHQVRLASGTDYPDYLEGDPISPGVKPKLLTRSNKEKCLADLISIWPESADFLASLHKIDDKAYRQATSNYRNLASHSISPRLGLGVTRAVVRSVEQATQMTRQPDGTYLPTPIAGKMSVRYDFGGTEPLDMEDARAANLEQYRRARECYANYRIVLSAGLASLPPVLPKS